MSVSANTFLFVVQVQWHHRGAFEQRHRQEPTASAEGPVADFQG
jgi:hypothetical protein